MDELTSISNELALMRRQFDKRHALLELRLSREQQRQSAQEQSVEQKVESKVEPQFTSMPEPLLEPVSVEVKTVEKPKSTAVKKANWFIQLDRQFSDFLGGVLASFISSILTFFASWAAPFVAVHQHFKSRNMTAMLWLMVVGVGFTVAGFGYLLQLVALQANAGLKVIGIGLLSGTVIALGAQLKQRSRFTEFASSIIALGLILAFSCVYFAGSVYQLISQAAILFAYVSVALISHVLSVRYQCSWLGAMGIIGVSLLPLVSGANQVASDWYLLALWLTCASSLFMAVRAIGMWLAALTLVCVVAAFELLLSLGNSFAYGLAFEGFYLLLFGFTVLLAKLKAEKVKTILLFGLSLAVSFIAILLQIKAELNGALTAMILINVVAALLASVYLRQANKLFCEVMVMLAGLWAAGAAMTIFSQSHWGLVWAIEGLSLIWLGKKLQADKILGKGQLLAVIGLVYCLIAIAPDYPAPALVSFDGISLLVACVLLVHVWQRLEGVASKNSVVLSTLESILITVMAIGLVRAWIGPYSASMAVVLQLVWLYRAKVTRFVSLEYLAFALMLVPLQEIYQGASLVGSGYFIDWPIFAQLATVILAVQMWGLAFCYRRFFKQNRLNVVAEACRSLFYLVLPISYVCGAFRALDVDAVALLWLSPLMSLLLIKRFNQYWVSFYASVIVVVSSIAFVALLFDASNTAALVAMAGFGGFYLMCFYLESRYQHHLAMCFASFGYFVWGIGVFVWILSCCGEPLFSLLFAAIYWGIGLFDRNMVALFKRNHSTITLFNMIVYSWAWIGSLVEQHYAFIPAVGLLLAGTFKFINRGTAYQLPIFSTVNGQLRAHAFIAITYLTFFYGKLSRRLKHDDGPSINHPWGCDVICFAKTGKLY